MLDSKKEGRKATPSLRRKRPAWAKIQTSSVPFGIDC